jgi:hypothetical protein
MKRNASFRIPNAVQAMRDDGIAAGPLAKAAVVAAMLAIILFAWSPTAAQATGVRLVNYAQYTYKGSVADLSTDGVENSNSSPSGPLRLELWAFAAPFPEMTAGELMAVFPFAALPPGGNTGSLDSGPIPFLSPPVGTWYFTMVLTEFTGASPNDDGYEVRYWINFDTPEYIGVARPANKEMAVEFYHPGLDHYFIAASASDISDLDNGVQQGWWRTGYTFNVWGGTGGDGTAVCRYYIPPPYGDSHFFSASPRECSVAPVMFPWIVKESDSAFFIALPDTDSGACAVNEVPVYRLWNARVDSNHRYTTSPEVKAAMIANRYVAEGFGADAVAMCAPQ